MTAFPPGSATIHPGWSLCGLLMGQDLCGLEKYYWIFFCGFLQWSFDSFTNLIAAFKKTCDFYCLHSIWFWQAEIDKKSLSKQSQNIFQIIQLYLYSMEKLVRWEKVAPSSNFHFPGNPSLWEWRTVVVGNPVDSGRTHIHIFGTSASTCNTDTMQGCREGTSFGRSNLSHRWDYIEPREIATYWISVDWFRASLMGVGRFRGSLKSSVVECL